MLRRSSIIASVLVIISLGALGLFYASSKSPSPAKTTRGISPTEKATAATSYLTAYNRYVAGPSSRDISLINSRIPADEARGISAYESSLQSFSNALVGVEVPPADQADFKAVVAATNVWIGALDYLRSNVNTTVPAWNAAMDKVNAAQTTFNAKDAVLSNDLGITVNN